MDTPHPDDQRSLTEQPSLSLADRRRQAAQRQDELADILAGAVFDLFLRRLQENHRGPRSEQQP